MALDVKTALAGVKTPQNNVKQHRVAAVPMTVAVPVLGELPMRSSAPFWIIIQVYDVAWLVVGTSSR